MSNNKSNSDPPAPAPEPEQPLSEVAFELSLEDTVAQQSRGLAPKGRPGAVVGYDPYDAATSKPLKSAAVPLPEENRKPTDLRKLSEWIRLQRQVQALKKEDEPDTK